jgi:hypothetical protein
MIALIENILLALTDAQFDKVLVMLGDWFSTLKEAINALWVIASPLLVGLVSLQLYRYQMAAKEARETIVKKIDDESTKSQEDRSKIIEDLQTNTKISEDAFKAANSHNAKIAAVVEYVKPKLPPIP